MAEKKKTELVIETGVSQELDRFEAWVIENNKKILAVCAGIVAVVAVAATVWMWVSGAENRSRAAFASAETKTDIETVLKEYSSGAAASEAKVRLARMYSKDKEYGKAAELLNTVANDAEVIVFLRGRAAVESAGNYELAGKMDEALKGYAAAADNTAFEESVRVEAAYNQGRLLAAKKDYAGAKLAFKRASVKNSADRAVAFWSGLAGRALDRLPAGK
jgi:tetratricopeptide (TPR) repeat protein